MPTQALNSSTGAWRARYFSEFYDLSGRHWRVELIDSETQGHQSFGLAADTVKEVELAGEGFTLSWDGATDHVGGQIIPSSCRVTWIVDDNNLELLKNVVKNSDDSRLAIAIYQDRGAPYWLPYWVGCLNHEAVEYETQDLPYLFTINANCGLNRLSNVDFRDSSGGVYTDDASIAEVFARCINKIPTASFWLNSEVQMREVVDLYSEDIVPYQNTGFNPTSEGDPFPCSVIERTVVSSLTFSDEGDVTDDEFGRRIKHPANFMSCKKVLENIANAFGARITLARFSFWFFPANALNWTHDSVTLIKWDRSRVASEDISTRMLMTLNLDHGVQSQNNNFRVDLDANYSLGEGWSNSYLLPVKRCTLTFQNAGVRSVFGSTSGFYLDYPNNGSGTRNRVNNDIVMSEGDLLTFKGVYSTDLVKEFGNAITGTAFDDHGSDRIGARVILRFKIKINTQGGTPYYYVSEYNVETGAHTDIDMPNGFGGDLTDPDIAFNRINLDSPQWQTTEGFFDIIVPWTNSTPEASVETSGGWNRVGGLHIEAQQNGEFKYRINSTQWDDVLQPFDFTTIPLPSNLSSYEGIRVDIDRIVVTRNGGVRQTFPQLDHIFHSAYVDNYDHNGNTTQNFQNIPEDRIDDFVVTLGSNSDDADWDMFVEQDSNSEFLDCGETTIGSNSSQGYPMSDGAVRLIPFGGSISTPLPNTTPEWNSITDSIDGDQDNDSLQYAMLREQLFQRGKALRTQRGDIFPQVSTAQNLSDPIDILSVIHHNCGSTGDVEEYLVPFALTHNGSSDSYSVDAWMIGKEVLSFTLEEEKQSKGAGFGSTGVGGGQPTGFNHTTKFGHTQTQMHDFNNAVVLRDVYESQPADSVTPTGALSSFNVTVGQTITWTPSNFDGVTTYVCTITRDTDGTVLTRGTDFTQSGGAVSFTVPNYVGNITLNVIGVSAGLRRSRTATFSMRASASNVRVYSYLKISGVEANGTPTHKPLQISEVQIYSLPSLQGTDNPTQAWASSTPLSWRVFQGTGTGTGGNAWDDNLSTSWTSNGLSSSQASQNFVILQYTGSGREFPMGSLRVVANKDSKNAPAMKVEVSNDGSRWTQWALLTGVNSGSGQANFDENRSAP